MNKHKIVITSLVVGLLLIMSAVVYSQVPVLSKPKAPRPATPRFEPAQLELSKATSAFGLNVLNRLIEQDPEGNVFISPYSIAAALSMVYNGAGGQTRDELKQTLGFGDLSDRDINESFKKLHETLTGLDEDVTMEIANSIWYREGKVFKQPFLDINREYFDAEVSSLDFNSAGAADVINKWVKDKTHERINGIVKSPIPPEMMMYLLNAIYFKGTWTHKFDSLATQDDFFALLDGDSTAVRMMKKTREYSYSDDSTAQMISLPYGQENFDMVVMLPHPGIDINAFVAGLTPDSLHRKLMFLNNRKGTIKLPRFKIEFEAVLNSVLQDLGIRRAFSEDSADFFGISDDTLFISEVRHKSFVEVNEEGTEAAAVTSIGMVTSVAFDMPKPPFEMIVDRPFVFLIRELHSGSILFMGRVTDPGPVE